MQYWKRLEWIFRQLLSHLGGVRHYLKKGELAHKPDDIGDKRFSEFLLNKRFDSVGEALDIFKDDELLSSPGENSNWMYVIIWLSNLVLPLSNLIQIMHLAYSILLDLVILDNLLWQ